MYRNKHREWGQQSQLKVHRDPRLKHFDWYIFTIIYIYKQLKVQSTVAYHKILYMKTQSKKINLTSFSNQNLSSYQHIFEPLQRYEKMSALYLMRIISKNGWCHKFCSYSVGLILSLMHSLLQFLRSKSQAVTQ